MHDARYERSVGGLEVTTMIPVFDEIKSFAELRNWIRYFFASQTRFC